MFHHQILPSQIFQECGVSYDLINQAGIWKSDVPIRWDEKTDLAEGDLITIHIQHSKTYSGGNKDPSRLQLAALELCLPPELFCMDHSMQDLSESLEEIPHNKESNGIHVIKNFHTMYFTLN